MLVFEISPLVSVQQINLVLNSQYSALFFLSFYGYFNQDELLCHLATGSFSLMSCIIKQVIMGFLISFPSIFLL